MIPLRRRLAEFGNDISPGLNLKTIGFRNGTWTWIVGEASGAPLALPSFPAIALSDQRSRTNRMPPATLVCNWFSSYFKFYVRNYIHGWKKFQALFLSASGSGGPEAG